MIIWNRQWYSLSKLSGLQIQIEKFCQIDQVYLISYGISSVTLD